MKVVLKNTLVNPSSLCCDWLLITTTPTTTILCGNLFVPLSSGCVSISRFGKTALWIAAMSVQVVAAKMAEVELKDVPKKELPVVSPVTSKTDEKGPFNNEANVSVMSPMSEPGVRGDPSPVSPNPVKMPQASAMKRPDPQQNGGEAFINSDGTVAEAPRMKKVIRAELFLCGGRNISCATKIELFEFWAFFLAS